MTLAIVRLNQTLFNQGIANITCWDNFQEDSSWLQEFADEFRESANDNWDNHMVTNWTLDNITVSFIEGDHITYSVDVAFSAGDLQGNQIGQGLPSGVAALISTRYVGPAPNRGRIFFSGMAEDSQNDGQFENVVMAGLKSLVEDWRDGLNVLGTTSSLQILRRPSDKFPTYVANPVQIVTRTDFSRSQRRRNLNQ